MINSNVGPLIAATLHLLIVTLVLINFKKIFAKTINWQKENLSLEYNPIVLNVIRIFIKATLILLLLAGIVDVYRKVM